MNIINEYTYNHLKQNKRHTISIIIAITISSALLCSLCIFIHTIWKSKISSTIEKTGYWHGELWESIPGNKLKYITENPNIKTTMVKGSWITAKLSKTKRPYLLMRDANSDFWNDMNFKNIIIKGKLPANEGEIVVSKLFFLENPEYKIGDTLTLPIGNRMIGNKIIKTQEYKQAGETFNQTNIKTYKLVGELDISGGTIYPGYIAMGYLNISKIKPTDELTVYMRFNNPHKIYELLPKIAKSVGLNKDEYGKYKILYNTNLLSLYGIYDKNNSDSKFILIIGILISMTILVISAFVLIIYNAFAISANSRIKELSILKSLGTTPKQIKHSVIFEGFLLWIVQLPLGLFIGYLFSYIVIFRINRILSSIENFKEIDISLSFIVIAFASILSLITVLISSYIPARKISKISSIIGISQNTSSLNIKRQKKHTIIKKIFGIEGDLAITQFLSSKKSFRTTILSISICFTLVIVYINIISIYNFANSKNYQKVKYNMSVNLDIADEPNPDLIKKILLLPNVNDSVIKKQVRTSTYVTPSQESSIFHESGGFKSINKIKYNVSDKHGKYKIINNLVGLSDDSFKKYCKEIGIDFSKYYNYNIPKCILLDSTYHTLKNSKYPKKIPLLNIKKGSILSLNENTENELSNDKYKFNIKIEDITDVSPSDLNTNRYSITCIMPIDTYQKIVSNFMYDRILEYNSISIDLLVDSKFNSKLKENLNKICSSYLGSEDFRIWSLIDEQAYDQLVQKAINISVFSITSMIGLIGIFNAFSTVLNNIRLRKREFSIFRSIGLTPKGLNKMLILEGLFLSITPIIISIPIISFISWYMLKITLTTFSEFISIFKINDVLIYTICLTLSIFLSYYFSSIFIKKSNLIESIKNEII